MARRTTRKRFEPGRGYTRKDWEAVESPPLTEAEIASAKPFAEAFPDLDASIKRARGRPLSERPKKLVSLRIDADVIERFRAGGPGWQSRINAALRKATKVRTGR